jgi:phospholipase C
MRSSISHLALLAAGTFVIAAGQARAQALEMGIKNIETVVVIYAENRSFDNE